MYILWLCHWYCDFSIHPPQIGVRLQFHLRGALPQTQPLEKNPWLFVQGPHINWLTLKSRNHSPLCRTHQPSSWSVTHEEYCAFGSGKLHHRCHPEAYLAHSPFICHILVHWRHPEKKRTMLSGLLPVPRLHKNSKAAIPMGLSTTSIESLIKQLSVEIPLSYYHFQDIFCPQRATQLSPHWPWDCAIDLLLVIQCTAERFIHYQKAKCHGYIHPLSRLYPSIYLPCCFKLFCCCCKKGLQKCPCFAALELLRGVTIFIKLDLHSAYNLIWIRMGINGPLCVPSLR